MTSESALQLASGLATNAPLPNLAVAANSKRAKAAIKRCMNAWQRAYDAYMEKSGGEETDEIFAKHSAAPAYRRALPPLAGPDGIRDFIACVAHGILIEAISEKRASQLLYAAQVAQAAIRCDPKPGKAA